MKQKKILMSSYLLSLSLSVLGAFLKIVHSPYGEFFLVASALFAIVFIVLALKEIWMSNRIDITEKMMWTIAVTFLFAVGSLLYLLVRREKVVN